MYEYRRTEELKEVVKKVSLKYKSTVYLNEWWRDSVREWGVECDEDPLRLPAYCLYDYTKSDSPDRLPILKEVACNDIYKVEQVASYYRHYNIKEPIYHSKLKEIMETPTPEKSIPEWISHAEFYELEQEVCKWQDCLKYVVRDKIEMPVRWNNMLKRLAWHRSQGHEVQHLHVNPPWGTTYISFSLEEVLEAILYAQTHGRSIGVSDNTYEKVMATSKGICPFCGQSITKYNQLGIWYLFPKTFWHGTIINGFDRDPVLMCTRCYRIWKPAWDKFRRIRREKYVDKEFANTLDDNMKTILKIDKIGKKPVIIPGYNDDLPEKVSDIAYARKIRKVKAFLQQAK